MTTQVDDWVEAGLYDPAASTAAERYELLTFLSDVGCSIEEMVEADQRGRLFALPGDVAIRGGRPIYTIEQLVDRLEEPPEKVSALWHSLGFEAVGQPDTPVATEADERAIRTGLVLSQLIGDERAIALLQTYAVAMARVAEAAAASFRPVADVSVRRSGSELTTAKSWYGLSGLVAEVGHLLDVTHRHQIDSVRRHFEAAGTEADLADADQGVVRVALGFVDLSGFTVLSQTLQPGELAELLSTFERTTNETARQTGCRVVKFVGDAAMLVSHDCSALATAVETIVHAISEPFAARAAVSFGEVVAREGDYFGPSVNLAARMLAAAQPGWVVASNSFVASLADDWESVELESHSFRGYAEPVPVYRVTGISRQR